MKRRSKHPVLEVEKGIIIYQNEAFRGRMGKGLTTAPSSERSVELSSRRPVNE
jgi:hypothetical protein